MPIYEYFCQNCENKFEIKVSVPEKEKGSKVNCLSCGSNKTIQIFGNFFTFSKGKSSNISGSACGSNPFPGCCK